MTLTHYAVFDDRDELIACWEAGYGETAVTVAALPPAASRLDRLVLAEALTRLSHNLWHCYTHPASAMHSTAENTEGWRRQRKRASFAIVPDAIRQPNLPDDDETLIVSYNPIEESAHSIGRLLHDLDTPGLTAAVITDVEAELTAVERAEQGDLIGRAQQATALAREDFSPLQVATADQIFATRTLGSSELFLHCDPTAAAIAAAHWLTAAAEVVQDLTGWPASTVVARADRIQAIPYTTPTTVLEMIVDGRRPADVVMELIQEAILIADGELLPNSAGAYAVIDADAQSSTPGAPPTASAVRLTPLDPHRPARDLLEDLLAGIRGCWLVYEATSTDDEAGASFDRAVRERAAAEHDRLC